MESHVEENQYSTTDEGLQEMMYEMKVLPSNQEQEQQCQVQLQHSKKYIEDKWPLRIVICLLAIILLLLIVLVGMCGFIISQSSAECSATATGATNAGLTATDNRMCQLCNESITHFAQEIHKRIGNIDVTNSTEAFVQRSIEQLALLVEINSKVNNTDELLEAAILTNGVTNSTKALVQGSIEQLALLVGIAQEINWKVNNTDELLEAAELANDVTNSTKVLVQGSIEQLALLVGIAQEINWKVNNTDELLEATVLTKDVTNSTKALVQGSIEQLALLVDIAEEINQKVNNTYTNELLYRITNVTHNTNALAWDNMENLVKVNNSFRSIDASIENSAEFLSLIQTSLNNNTNLLEMFAASNSDSLTSIVNTLSNLQDTSTSTAGVVDDILLIAQELLVLHNDSTALPTSCNQLKSQYPISPSGYYVLASANGSATYTAYCNMGLLCGSGGGWTRLAYLDMSDSSQNCPSGLQYYSSAGLRTCGKKNTTGATCDSVQFSSNGISYSQVCGRVVGYQYGTPDAVHPPTQNIDSVYLDGVSITHGGSPRQHIWSLLVGVHSNKSYFDNCPCAGGDNPQSFIGNDYYCESANPTDSWDPVFYSTDPLWDGKGCDAAEAGCCSDSRLPWFNKTLNATTTDYLEMRVCVDQGTHTEDIKLTFYELYVK